MKFAKYWKKVDLPVTEKVFGRPVISIWGASNENLAHVESNAQNRSIQLQSLIGSRFNKRSEYEYWAGFVREEVIEEVKSAAGSILAVLSRNNYGAVVLNTESVVFGDIDLPDLSFFDRILEKLGKRKKDKRYFVEKIG